MVEKKTTNKRTAKTATSLVPSERIERAILLIRGHKVMLDTELADLYVVETGALVRQVKRNLERFPADFLLSEPGSNTLHERSMKATPMKRHPGSSGARQMQVWVDADACPGEIKELLFRAATQRKVKVTLVANQPLRTPKSAYVESIAVQAGMNVADRRILELVAPGDLVVTSDIPLAAEIVARGGQALNPRGELYTDSNVGECLAVRNMLDELRAGGQAIGGPSNFSTKDKQAFANQLDRWLTKTGS